MINMNKSSVDILSDYIEIEHLINKDRDEIRDTTSIATVRAHLRTKKMDNYESGMRLHAELCVAGR